MTKISDYWYLDIKNPEPISLFFKNYICTEAEYIGQGYTVKCLEQEEINKAKMKLKEKYSRHFYPQYHDVSFVKERTLPCDFILDKNGDIAPAKGVFKNYKISYMRQAFNYDALQKDYEEKLKLAKEECFLKYKNICQNTIENISFDLLGKKLVNEVVNSIQQRIRIHNSNFEKQYGFKNWLTFEGRNVFFPNDIKIDIDSRAYDYFERVLLKDWLDKAIDKAYKPTKENNMFGHCQEKEDLHVAIYETCAPGATQEETKVEVDNLKNEIFITSKIKTELRPETTYHKLIRLPVRYDKSKVSAEVKNGIITIKVPCLSDAVTTVEVK